MSCDQYTPKTGCVKCIIPQHSFKIIIETKVSADWNTNQLKAHLSALQGNEEFRFLLLLSKDELDSNLWQKVESIARENGRSIQPRSLTFAGLIQTVSNALNRDDEMLDILCDYQNYAKENGLISARASLLRVVPCGITWEINEKLNLYYEPTDRGAQQADYLGIYWGKAVRLVGKVRRIVEVRIENGAVISQESLNPDEKKRILEASTDAEQRGWKTNEFRRFTFVEHFYRTEFKKKSKGGLRKHRNFDLKVWLESSFMPDMDIQQIARKLEEHEGWE